MKGIIIAVASVTFPLLMPPEICLAQNYPHYPYTYKPGVAGIMGIGPGGRVAYRPSYYAAAPVYHYGYGSYGGNGSGPGYSFRHRVGMPPQPMAIPEAPLDNSYRSFYPSISPSQPNIAAMDIKLPPGAQLWFQGRLTRQKGSYRFFESPPLERGKTYAYQIRAVWTNEKGDKVERRRTVHIHAGDYVILDLSKPTS